MFLNKNRFSSEMKEKTLLQIALIAGIAGIVVLFFVSSTIEINEKTIDKINTQNVGEDVKLIGTIKNVYQSENAYFIEISQPSSLTIILFKDKNISLQVGDTVEIIGKIDEYEGKLEVIGQRVRVIE